MLEIPKLPNSNHIRQGGGKHHMHGEGGSVTCLVVASTTSSSDILQITPPKHTMSYDYYTPISQPNVNLPQRGPLGNRNNNL